MAVATAKPKAVVVEDLDVRYRPTTLDGVLGQPEALDVVRSWGLNPPRTIMFSGPPGTGKTTLARIIAHDVLDISDMDYQEINCGAVKSAIELVRDLTFAVTAAPTSGDKRMWTLDEAQVFSRAKGAAEALLKVLEDAKPHVVFVLCTTDPQRLLPAIRSRCCTVPLKAVAHDVLCGLVARVATAERVTLDDDLVARIADVANGSPRNALKELQKVLRIDDPAKRLAVVGGVGIAKAAGDLIRELMPWQGSPNWAGVAKVLADIKDEEPEGIRQMLLACARTNLLKGGKLSHPAYTVICAMDKPYFDKNSGHALLCAACWEIVNAANKR